MIRVASISNEHFVELELLEQADDAYGPGDVRLFVQVRSHGYAGTTQVWISQEQLRAFANSLRSLSETLRGSATLSSVSPNELALELRAVSSRGHLAASGSIGRHLYENERNYWHSVSFGFEFEPSQLGAILPAPWLPPSAA